ncbi:MAG: 50S ribosomal protein L9 [Parvibaculum sp.]
MQIILLERVEKLGEIGAVVNVKSGFARNFLLPQKKALRATSDNLAYFQTQRAEIEKSNAEARDIASQTAKTIDGKELILIRQAGDSGQLYGSVNARDIAEGASALGTRGEHSRVRLEKPIKTLGLHPVRVVLHPEVIVTMTANVAMSTEEAVMQRERGGAVTRADLSEAEEVREAAEAAFQASGTGDGDSATGGGEHESPVDALTGESSEEAASGG